MKLNKLMSLIISAATCLAFSANSQTIGSYGNWSMERFESGVLAIVTVNDENSFIGRRCLEETAECIYLMSQVNSCVEGEKSLVLINSDVGVFHSTLTCMRPFDVKGRQHYVLKFNESESISSILSKGKGVFGIAFGLESGRFAVNRFSLLGASEAMNKMFLEEIAMLGRKAKRKQGSGGSTKSQLL